MPTGDRAPTRARREARGFPQANGEQQPYPQLSPGRGPQLPRSRTVPTTTPLFLRGFRAREHIMETIVSMTGRLGNNVELRKTNAEVDYATFRLATNRRSLRDGAWVDGPTSWITVKCFRQLARNVAYSLRKGQPIVVVGRLEVEEWVTQTGVPRESAVLYAQAIGHDLNWGVSMLSRLERDKGTVTVPERPDDPEQPKSQDTDPAPFGYSKPHQDGQVKAGDQPDDDEDDDGVVAQAESYMASIGTPLGAGSR